MEATEREIAIREKARELLEAGEVKVVIGYGWNRKKTKTHPVFITKVEDVDKLIFNERCVNNLSIYLTRRYPDIQALGMPAIVAKGCDIRNIAILCSEGQRKREEVFIIGVPCDGVVYRQELWTGALTDETMSSKCFSCDVRNPHISDFVAGPEVSGESPGDEKNPDYEEIEKIDAMSPSERWGYWLDHFSRCIKCYACRQYCPLCYCERCITEKNTPQWIETSAHERGQVSWNIIRAMHLAGRCTYCGECDRSCPVNIPLNLVNQKLAGVVKESFDYKSGYDHEEHPPMIVYKEEDEENFIR